MKILVVEDDETLSETVAYNLTRQGHEVIQARDGLSGLNLARAESPDLILLDVMLPGMDGFDVCRTLRQEMNVPIIMLTARTEEIDKVVGLEVGADDYITKPFSMRELLARVKAMQRRIRLIREEISAEVQEVAVEPTAEVPQNERLAFGNLVVDTTRHEIRIDNQPLHVKPKEYELFVFLARHRGIALSRDLILERVWGWSFDGNSRTVDVHIRWLREKIEPNGTKPSRIVTVRGIGYRFEG